MQEVNESDRKHFSVSILKANDGTMVVQKAARGKKNVERLERELHMLKKVKEERVTIV